MNKLISILIKEDIETFINDLKRRDERFLVLLMNTLSPCKTELHDIGYGLVREHMIERGFAVS